MQLAVNKHASKTTRETWTLHHLTDVHADDSDFAADEFAARVKEIKDDPNAIWLGGGDYGSLILPEDKRFSTHHHEDVHRIPDQYVENVTELFLPIKDKCVGWGIGNHEDTVYRRYHRGVGAEIARNLGVASKYLGVRGWSVNQFSLGQRRLCVRAYWWHGWSAGRLKGRKALQAERDLSAWDADVLLLGHDHQPYYDIWFTEQAYSTKNGWALKQVPRAVLNGGSWTYGQRAPFDASTMKMSEIPNEKWAEGRNFRPQPPVNPKLLIHLDFGNSKSEQNRTQGRPSGYSFEIRAHAETFYVGGYAA